jgi:nucleoside-diphosphate-sugar epimerase
MPEHVDAVFHVAGDVSYWSRHNARQARCNVEGTRNLVAVALARGARRFVHTSTSGVYGLQPETFDETVPHLGRTSWINYMVTKAQAEEEVRLGIEQGLDAVLLNPANIIGRYDTSGWCKLFKLAFEGKLLRLPPGRSSFCHSREVARAHIVAVQSGRTGDNYLLGGVDASYADVVACFARLIQRDLQIRVGRRVVLKCVARVCDWLSRLTGREPLLTPESAAYVTADVVCRCDKAIRELNYVAASLKTMVEDWYCWANKEGLLAMA